MIADEMLAMPVTGTVRPQSTFECSALSEDKLRFAETVLRSTRGNSDPESEERACPCLLDLRSTSM